VVVGFAVDDVSFFVLVDRRYARCKKEIFLDGKLMTAVLLFTR